MSMAPLLETFSTAPQSSDVPAANYAAHTADVARWSERAGCTGILVYTDHRLADAWLVSQIIIQSTQRLCPLVAVQPAYMHPYTVANMVASFGYLYGRRVYLNMVAGGFANDLKALNDNTPHDKRYARLIEYTVIIRELLARSSTGEPFSLAGEFYTVENLRLTPALPPSLMPGVFVSGSSDAGLAAAKAMGATAVEYPRPVGELGSRAATDGLDAGIRIGIIARRSEDDAWAVAHQRFPEDRKGQLTHQLAMKVSDSVWHKQLSDVAESLKGQRSPYWLLPFQNYKTFCPYLVGSYDTVAAELAAYVKVGFRKLILDIPPNQEELEHTEQTFTRAAAHLMPVSECLVRQRFV